MPKQGVEAMTEYGLTCIESARTARVVPVPSVPSVPPCFLVSSFSFFSIAGITCVEQRESRERAGLQLETQDLMSTSMCSIVLLCLAHNVWVFIVLWSRDSATQNLSARAQRVETWRHCHCLEVLDDETPHVRHDRRATLPGRPLR